MVHSDSLANHRDHYDGERFGINPTMTFAVNSDTEIGLSFEYLDHERYIDRGYSQIDFSRVRVIVNQST